MPTGKTTLFAQKRDDMPFEFEQTTEFYEFERQAPSGRYVIEYKKDRPPKSQGQLGYIFGGMISKVKQEGNETRQDGVDGLLKYLLDPSIPKNQPLTDDFIKALFYAIAPTFDNKGRKITLSSMNTVQANDFMKRIQDMMAGYVYLEDPNPDWRNECLPTTK